MSGQLQEDITRRVVETARAIRPFLPALLGAETPVCDRELRTLLTRHRAGDDVRDEVLALLGRWPATQAWAVSMLADPAGRPPGLQPPAERTYSALPGPGEPVELQRFSCPSDGDYVWYRTSAAAKVPECPDHGERLVVDSRPGK